MKNWISSNRFIQKKRPPACSAVAQAMRAGRGPSARGKVEIINIDSDYDNDHDYDVLCPLAV
ncbi:MAG: hypothetical protein ACLFRL_08385, partial [Desulfohalobiaceae bacterium]